MNGSIPNNSEDENWICSKKLCLIKPVSDTSRKEHVDRNDKQSHGSAVITSRTALSGPSISSQASNRKYIQRNFPDIWPDFCELPDWAKCVAYSEYEVPFDTLHIAYFNSSFRPYSPISGRASHYMAARNPQLASE